MQTNASLPCLCLVLMAVLSVPAQSVKQSSTELTAANPIRKVVTMLQSMQKKVQEEGEREAKLYDSFMCYCSTGGKDLEASISAAEAKGPAVSSGIKEAEGKLEQTKSDLKQAQVDRVGAKDAMAEATAIREKEAAAFAAEKGQSDTNIAAMKKAVAALEKGMAGGFLQTGAAQVIRQLALSSQSMVDEDRKDLLVFFSEGDGSKYAPKSGEITGILKEMLETMEKGLAEATAAEEDSIKSFEGLMAAKKKEVEALTLAVEAKTAQIGELGVAIVQMKEDFSDTEAGLAEDKEFLAGLSKNCRTKTTEWEERSKLRAEELVALADTIKVLNDDDALDLFKKTLPRASASFVQVSVSSSELRAKAMAAFRQARGMVLAPHRAGLDALLLALSGRRALAQGGFEKVIKMCDEMVAVLKKEQVDDDSKKEYCAQQLDSQEDKKKELELAVSDATNAIATTQEGISTLTEEATALEKGIKALDKSVAEATEQRKEENAEYKDLMAADAAAKELLTFAKNRLNKFYNPKLYTAPKKEEVSAEDRIYANMGGELTTAPPGGIANTGVEVLAQVSAHQQRLQMRKDAPAPPPETWDAYTTKSEESSGVIAMLDLLIKDLDKEIREAEIEEKDAQADYEAMMKDSAEKRRVDSKSLTEKQSAKADLEGDLESHEEAKKSSGAELMAVLKYTQSLHGECDWLLQYFEVRKDARESEIDSLEKAKAVLSGADFSLLQTKASGFLGRSL